MFKEYYKNLLLKIKPQSLNLVEAFNHHDNVLNSCIGNSYGDIYEQQLEWAKASPLNKKEFIPGYREHMLPFYTSKL